MRPFALNVLHGWDRCFVAPAVVRCCLVSTVVHSYIVHCGLVAHNDPGALVNMPGWVPLARLGLIDAFMSTPG